MGRMSWGFLANHLVPASGYNEKQYPGQAKKRLTVAA